MPHKCNNAVYAITWYCTNIVMAGLTYYMFNQSLKDTMSHPDFLCKRTQYVCQQTLLIGTELECNA